MENLEHNKHHCDIIFHYLLYPAKDLLEPQDANFIGSLYNYYMRRGELSPKQFEGLTINWRKYYREEVEKKYKEEQENEDNCCW